MNLLPRLERLRATRTVLVAGWVACLPGILLAGADSPAAPALAEWDGGSVSLGEFTDRMKVYWAQRDSGGVRSMTPESLRNTQLHFLEEWVAGEILMLEAPVAGVEVSGEEVEGYLASHFPDEAQRKVTLIHAMVYEKDFREHVRRLLLREKLGRKLRMDSPAAEQDFLQWKKVLPLDDDLAPAVPNANSDPPGERRCAYQILFSKEDEATQCVGRLKSASRDDFVAEARKHPDSPQSAQGGFMGCFRKGQLPDYLEEVVFRLKPGELSDIIQSSNGYHLILVQDYAAESHRVEASRESGLRRRWESEIEEKRVGEWLGAAMRKRQVRINSGLLEAPSAQP